VGPVMTRTSPATRPAGRSKSRSVATHPRSRRAHTLTELLVVLTILSLFAGIVIPRAITAVVRTRLDAALDAVRADLTFTRARAVSTGLRHQFTLDPDTRQIRVDPFRPEQLDQTTAASAEQQQPPPLTDQLPETVRVSTWSVSPLGAAQGLPTAATATTQGGAQNAGGQLLVFYPEGRSDDAVIVLEDADGNRKGLRIDGFSGEIRDMQPDELR
ncbi:MAG TPA: prepilin-type N-terminal cleavage/methylation domain-containing protein, partial [Armatimonadota bacterium]|nr:prepilin-type N-terminal cleavage/methylation domain-containing protein [Armatimonadota bacterium]